jgi:hypothetical protein
LIILKLIKILKGDIIPITILGKIFAVLAAIIGFLIMALPISVISRNFSITIAKKRHQDHFINSKISKIDH